jgi:hypothetical protein
MLPNPLLCRIERLTQLISPWNGLFLHLLLAQLSHKLEQRVQPRRKANHVGTDEIDAPQPPTQLLQIVGEGGIKDWREVVLIMLHLAVGEGAPQEANTLYTPLTLPLTQVHIVGAQAVQDLLHMTGVLSMIAGENQHVVQVYDHKCKAGAQDVCHALLKKGGGASQTHTQPL